MLPVIGISSDFEEGRFCLREDYVRAVEGAGGLAVILPSMGEKMAAYCLEFCSGLLFAGGGDIDPVYWGEAAGVEMGRIDPQRDRFELLLARLAFRKRLPALGICRGCQVMNVAAGGSIWQNISSYLCHQQNAPRNYAIHDILVMEGSLLANILGEHSLRVNSFHHQAVAAAGSGLKASARAVDGIVEAIESEDHPFWLGVQWHPETLPDQPSANLFKALVRASLDQEGR